MILTWKVKHQNEDYRRLDPCEFNHPASRLSFNVLLSSDKLCEVVSSYCPVQVSLKTHILNTDRRVGPVTEHWKAGGFACSPD